MTRLSPAPLSPQGIASREEVEAAWMALTPNNRRQIETQANRWADQLTYRGKNAGYDGADLLSEALMRTLAGTRRWKLAIPFNVHLYRVMQSLVWNLREGEPEQFSTMRSAMQDGPERSALDDVASDVPDVERRLDALKRIQKIRALLKDDPVAMAVLEGRGSGMKGPELRKRTGLSTHAYEAAVKRLLRRAEPWRPGDLAEQTKCRCLTLRKGQHT